MSYEPYQQRVIAERDELNRRLITLNDFRNPINPVFAALGVHEKWLISRQAYSMEDYLEFLDERISMFNREGKAG
jgi:hypothetical protein